MRLIFDRLFPLDLDHRLVFEQGAHSALLLAHKWHRLQLLLPLLCDVDGVLLGSIVGDGVPLLVCVLDDLFHLLWMY